MDEGPAPGSAAFSSSEDKAEKAMKQGVDVDSKPSGCRENKLSLTIANSECVGRHTLLINLNSSTPTQNCCVLSCQAYTVRCKADLVSNNQSSQSGWVWAASALAWYGKVGAINCPSNPKRPFILYLLWIKANTCFIRECEPTQLYLRESVK